MAILDDDKILSQANQPPPSDGGMGGGAIDPAAKSILQSTPHPIANIPGSKIHEDGKMAYAQLMPKITADPGTGDYFRQRQEQLEFEKDHPNGAPISKHPGTFGTIIHGIAASGQPPSNDSRLGDDQSKLQHDTASGSGLEQFQQRHHILGGIARTAAGIGSAMFPGIAANIPGTDLHHQVILGQDRRAVGQDLGEQEAQGKMTTESQNAGAAVTRAGAEQERADTEAKMAGQPKPKEEKHSISKEYTDTDGTPLTFEENSGQLLRADNGKPPTGFKPVAPAKSPKDDTPEQQFIDAEGKAGKTVQQAEKEYANLKDEKPPQEPGNYLPINDAKGNTVGWVDPKSKHVVRVADLQGMAGEGGMAPGGAMPPKPTAQERNVGAQAAVAAEGIPTVVTEIDKLKDQLGPVSGRWNEFMQGKVGMENPEMAGLRADLLMVSSAVALAHARGRLPENLREEFDRTINAPRQDPENLKAALNHILPWMQRMQNMTDQPQGAAAGGGGNTQTSGKKWNPVAGKYE